jgi:hypothetical protein
MSLMSIQTFLRCFAAVMPSITGSTTFLREWIVFGGMQWNLTGKSIPSQVTKRPIYLSFSGDGDGEGTLMITGAITDHRRQKTLTDMEWDDLQ